MASNQRRADEAFTHLGRPLRAIATAAAFIACASPAVIPIPPPAPVTLADAAVPENTDVYRTAGFIVGTGAVPFVGMVRFVATEFLDSTAAVIGLSVPPRSLSFVRAGDRYAAFYSLRLDVLRGDAIIRSERPTGEVRVASFAETRSDEGVIFQRTIRVAPGNYALRVTAHDSLGTSTGTATASMVVPALGDGSVAPMIPVFLSAPRQARGAPLAIVVNPRATARYGRDSLLQMYIEGYGPSAPDTIIVTASRSDPAFASVLASDTVVTTRSTGVRAASFSFPVARLGLGVLRISATTSDGREIDATTALVNLGLVIPVTSVSELIDALKFFASESELQRFRAASDLARPLYWASLVRRTDPNPATPENEALLEYARRLRLAERYREGAAHGWQTDRGAVTVALGEPDQVTDPQPADSIGSGRVMTWEYRRHRLSLVFGDASGSGSWRLTPLSAADFRELVSLAGPCVGCR